MRLSIRLPDKLDEAIKQASQDIGRSAWVRLVIEKELALDDPRSAMSRVLGRLEARLEALEAQQVGAAHENAHAINETIQTDGSGWKQPTPHSGEEDVTP